ncbi:unnamed protein product [Rotaria sp. Silwood1]|nr:unnamed protein product [Rotaria sp. Silwood1]
MTLVTGNDSRPQSLVISDFNNDDLMDIGVVNSHTHNIGIFLGYGNISFANQMAYSTGLYSFPCSMAIGDFNNDTRVDIVFVSYGETVRNGLIGGKAILTGEPVDSINSLSRFWPRASVVAEKLWSSSTTDNNEDALPRFHIHRSRLLELPTYSVI